MSGGAVSTNHFLLSPHNLCEVCTNLCQQLCFPDKPAKLENWNLQGTQEIPKTLKNNINRKNITPIFIRNFAFQTNWMSLILISSTIDFSTLISHEEAAIWGLLGGHQVCRGFWLFSACKCWCELFAMHLQVLMWIIYPKNQYGQALPSWVRERDKSGGSI